MDEYVETLNGEWILFTGKVSDGGWHDTRPKAQALACEHGAHVLSDRNSVITLLVLGDYNPGAPKYLAENLGKKAMYAIEQIRQGRPVRIISPQGFFGIAKGKPAKVLNKEVLARLS